MNSSVSSSPVYEIRTPHKEPSALIFASPHSGRHYPTDFVENAALSPSDLRLSEDTFVDELYEAAPFFGAPLIRALFPRAFVDVNRDIDDLDPAMFEGKIRPPDNPKSARAPHGLGVIPRIVAPGKTIHRRLLPLHEAERRLDLCYRPWHLALSGLIEQAKNVHSRCILIDCHSMPDLQDQTQGRRIDFVLGDCHQASCSAALTQFVQNHLGDLGYQVAHNKPYAGGYAVRHYGMPTKKIHALQIEINRGLYMDEAMREKSSGFNRVKSHIDGLIEALSIFAVKECF